MREEFKWADVTENTSITDLMSWNIYFHKEGALYDSFGDDYISIKPTQGLNIVLRITEMIRLPREIVSTHIGDKQGVPICVDNAETLDNATHNNRNLTYSEDNCIIGVKSKFALKEKNCTLPANQ